MACTNGIVALLLLFTPLNAQFQSGKGKKISCKNAKGMDVDWFVVYKLPKTSPKQKNYMTLSGGEMAYYDSSSKKGEWTSLLPDIYRSDSNPVQRTLAPIFGPKPDKNVAFVAYNDQPPPMVTNKTRGGHAKGIVMAGYGPQRGMVWLQHSVPRFPEDMSKGYAYPGSGRENGQLFFCISMPLVLLNLVAKHLQVQQANVYLENAPVWAKGFPDFWRILTREYERMLPMKIDFMWTNRGKPVLAIAKPPKWPKDIYTDELGKHMNDSITVQSWRNGAGQAQTKFCTKKYSVTDVDVIGVHTVRGYAEFSTREDHSKWYVTRHHGVFCFSSLNRMISQMKRGGEITCVIDIPLANLFRKSIAKRTSCANEKPYKSPR